MFGNDRRQPRVQKRKQALGDHGPCPGCSHRQQPRPQQHHRAHHLALDLCSHAGGVGANQGALELLASRGWDQHERERAEPGRDAIHGFPGVAQLGDDRGAALHRGEGIGAQRHLGAGSRDGEDLRGLQSL